MLLNSQSLLLIQIFFLPTSPFHNIIFCHYRVLQRRSLIFLSLHSKWSQMNNGSNLFSSFAFFSSFLYLIYHILVLFTQHFSVNVFLTSVHINYKNVNYIHITYSICIHPTLVKMYIHFKCLCIHIQESKSYL